MRDFELVFTSDRNLVVARVGSLIINVGGHETFTDAAVAATAINSVRSSPIQTRFMAPSKVDAGLAWLREHVEFDVAAARECLFLCAKNVGLLSGAAERTLR